MSRSGHKLKINGEDYLALITYNPQDQALEIITKSHQKSDQFWGNFTIKDLDPQVTTLLQTIEYLYSYLCQNQEQIEIYRDRIVIRLNCLKYSKDIVLKLNPMMMFSLQEHSKLANRIKVLQEENRKLKSKEEGCRKLTMNFNQNSVNFNHYCFEDISKISSYDRLKPLNLLRICADNTLPDKGVWIFDIYLIKFHQEVFSRHLEPWIELGIKGQEGQKRTIKLEGFQPEKEGNKVVKAGSWLRVFLNFNKKQLAVVKCYQPGQQRLVWSDFKTDGRLWLIMVIFGMTIQTDMFLQQKIVNWTITPIQQNQQQNE